mmetsp:Transcript_14726/g.35554  ORF Transcript_14726/g.35554 Transcript_14726/m.35554 type:complete len:436 (+) Transcript_14726:476-1783(+)
MGVCGLVEVVGGEAMRREEKRLPVASWRDEQALPGSVGERAPPDARARAVLRRREVRHECLVDRGLVGSEGRPKLAIRVRLVRPVPEVRQVRQLVGEREGHSDARDGGHPRGDRAGVGDDHVRRPVDLHDRGALDARLRAPDDLALAQTVRCDRILDRDFHLVEPSSVVGEAGDGDGGVPRRGAAHARVRPHPSVAGVAPVGEPPEEEGLRAADALRARWKPTPLLPRLVERAARCKGVGAAVVVVRVRPPEALNAVEAEHVCVPARGDERDPIRLERRDCAALPAHDDAQPHGARNLDVGAGLEGLEAVVLEKDGLERRRLREHRHRALGPRDDVPEGRPRRVLRLVHLKGDHGLLVRPARAESSGVQLKRDRSHPAVGAREGQRRLGSRARDLIAVRLEKPVKDEVGSVDEVEDVCERHLHLEEGVLLLEDRD